MEYLWCSDLAWTETLYCLPKSHNIQHLINNKDDNLFTRSLSNAAMLVIMFVPMAASSLANPVYSEAWNLGGLSLISATSTVTVVVAAAASLVMLASVAYKGVTQFMWLFQSLVATSTVRMYLEQISRSRRLLVTISPSLWISNALLIFPEESINYCKMCAIVQWS